MTVGLKKHAKGLSFARKHNPKLCDQEKKKKQNNIGHIYKPIKTEWFQSNTRV